MILNEDGEFVNGFRLRRGVFVSRFVGSLSSPKSKSQRVVELESCDEFYYTCGVQGIDEIILTSSGSGSAINNGSVTIFTFPPRGGGISIGVNNGDVEVPLGGSSGNSHYNPGGSSAGEPLFPCGDSLHGCEKMKCEDGSNQDYYGNCIGEEDNEPSCESFDFETVSTDWQASVISDFHVKIKVGTMTNYQRYAIDIPLLTFETWEKDRFNNTLSSGAAAELSAESIQEAVWATIRHFQDQYGFLEYDVNRWFEDRLKRVFRERSDGGRVRRGNPYNINVNEYKNGRMGGCE